MKCFLFPDIGRVDEALQLHMDGLEANEHVTIRMGMDDEKNGMWNSTIITKADNHGKLLIGDNEQTEENIFSQLIWNLRPIDGKNAEPYTLSKEQTTLNLHIDIEGNSSQRTESRTISRIFKEDYVAEEELPTDLHLTGTYFYPIRKRNLPSLIILGSTSGLTANHLAALFASRGYGAIGLSLAGDTVHGEQTKKSQSQLPIEDVQQVVKWLKNHPSTDEEKIVLYGVSKNSELALLAASKDKNIRGVIAVCPSTHVFQSLHSKRRQSPWTEQGKGVPFIPLSNSFSMLFQSLKEKVKQDQKSTNELYERSLNKYKQKGRTDAIIKVENINGPVLLLSGKEDTYWPSYSMAESIKERLIKNSFPYLVQHSSFEFTGHSFTYPYLPCLFSNNSLLHTDDLIHKSAQAGEKAWAETITFLSKHFPPAKIPTEAIPFQTIGK
ncbi:acyl-CoA thioester hydrolase/BAAT C-terminal domain-containing protein [Evansella sp. AB-P1]|uniref:acyl-CoA thioester hydrolase/BAAT C-terminal domain-containing protein n=1 Tax=Evansella sp. AB-P1 TaxID=3037653 RepID=UPI00241EB142|nr:acyl-CoA thioester hydrolase/BAAT C-terminal domain-containing protein [Evansella sp. AB-P1]MDG5788788.1 acyl-CoA thioester hydrolase/BAAT C-terminal domain-containing protein [Evansella sp. AB-P1]